VKGTEAADGGPRRSERGKVGLGDGAHWIWNLAKTHFPNVPQTLDTYHLKEHLYEFANLHYKDPCRAKAWVQMKVEALRENRTGDVLGGLKKMKPRKKIVRATLRGLIVYVENNKDRIRYQEPWEAGLAVGSGSVEGACKHVIQPRFKRAGMRWKTPGFLSVVELRVARLNGTESVGPAVGWPEGPQHDLQCEAWPLRTRAHWAVLRTDLATNAGQDHSPGVVCEKPVTPSSIHIAIVLRRRSAPRSGRDSACRPVR
jgi:hypothetical protein